MTLEAQQIAIAEVHFDHWLASQGFRPHQRTDDIGLAFRGGSSLGLWIYSNENQTRFWGYNYQSEVELRRGEVATWMKTRDYLSDLNTSIALCDFLADKGWRCQLANGLDKTWECEFYRPRTEDTPQQHSGCLNGEEVELYYHESDTLAEAICGSFLRTFNLWTK